MKILFITHDAFRTGAPILILNLAKIIAEETKNEVSFYVKNSKGDSGLLIEEFKKVGPTYLSFDEIFIEKKITRLDSLFGKKPSPYDFEFNYDVIISNTITNGELYAQLKKTNKPILTYVHELEMGVEAFTSKENLKCVLDFTDLYIVVSEAVRNYLINKLNVSPKIICKLNSYIPNDRLSEIITFKPTIESKFHVGSVGTTDWRKGGDLFIVLVKEYFIKYPDSDILFTWKGCQPGTLEYKRLLYDIEKAGLVGKLIYEIADNNVNDYYQKIDLFLLTSREDPYPLVVLEAAKHKIPTICFEYSGGITEFVEESKGGKIVPYLSLPDMVEAIRDYYVDREKLLLHGKNAYNAVEIIHQDKKLVINQFEDILLKSLS